MNRAKVGTEIAAARNMQGSSDMRRRIPGNQCCIDDYVQLQAMSMDRRNVNGGLEWQSAATAASVVNLQHLGSWVQEPEPSKVRRVKESLKKDSNVVHEKAYEKKISPSLVSTAFPHH